MAVTLSPDVLEDGLAVSLACALAVANRRAAEAGTDVAQSLISITQRFVDDRLVWRVNYGPRDYLSQRGGDLIVDVDTSDGSVAQVLRGQ
jgi:hypothetical protein